jgi:hypothetical protein
MLATLDTLYEVQRHLLDEMPEPGTNVRSALDKLDLLIYRYAAVSGDYIRIIEVTTCN